MAQAAVKGRAACIEVLLRHNADFEAEDVDGDTPINLAAGSGNTQSVLKLVKKCAKTDVKGLDGNTALLWAAFFGRLENLSILLDQGVDIEATNKTKLRPVHLTSFLVMQSVLSFF